MTRSRSPVLRRYVNSIGLVTIAIAVFVFSGSSAHTQHAPAVSHIDDLQIPLVQQADCLAFGDARTALASQAGALRAIGSEPGHPIRHPRPVDALAGPEPAARSYLSLCGSLFGLPDHDELQLKRQESATRMADDGHLSRRSIVRFQQAHDGVPVIGGELVVHLDEAQNILFVGGKTSSKPMVDVIPTVMPEAASDAALAVVAKAHDIDRAALVPSIPELWIYEPRLIGPDAIAPALVWRLTVSTSLARPIREVVLVDAHHPAIALHFNQAEAILNRATYDSNHTTGIKSLACDESNPTCAGGDADAIFAHRYAADTYAFYRNILGRDSIDNAGMTMISSVHYGAVGYQNAFWNGSQLFYGDGFPAADDVVGHEFTHGVTQFTSGLFPWYQSGAISESISDVFGELIDQTNLQGNDSGSVRWLIGEDLPIGAIRSMSNPPAFGGPDKISSSNYYLGTDDNGGIHRNSGVNNKAASLLVDGGTFNGHSVLAIGFAKTAYIYYEAQTHLLTSGSDYADLHEGLFQACLNLIGLGGINGLDCQQVRSATLAVEMNQQPASFGAEAPLCAITSPIPVNLFFDDLETGSSNWTTTALAGTSRWSSSRISAHSGTVSLFGDGSPGEVSDSYVAMTTAVRVPDMRLPETSHYLRFSHAFGFESASNVNYDGGVLEYTLDNSGVWIDASSLFDSNGYNGVISTVSGNPLGGRVAFVGDSHGYTSTRLKLDAIGSTGAHDVRFRWRMAGDRNVASVGWFVDDVQLYTCRGANFAPDSITPSAGTGRAQTFTLQYSDSGGASDLGKLWVWFTPLFTSPTAHSCFAYFDTESQTWNLLDDTGIAWIRGPIGTAGSVANSQCAIGLNGRPVSGVGNILTLDLPLTFSSMFSGPMSIFMSATQVASHGGFGTEWLTAGTWTPAPGPSVVNADSVRLGGLPISAVGVQMDLSYSDSAGATDLTTAWVWLSPSLASSSGHSCIFFYERATNTVNLLNDAGTMWISGAAGGVGRLENSQCWFDLSGVAVGTGFPSDKTLLWRLVLNFRPTFAGAKTIFMYAANGSGINSGWQARGAYVVPAAPAVSVNSAQFFGAGASQTFTLVSRDTAGAADLATTWLWFTPSAATSANSCMMYYSRATNTVNLLNDAATTWMSAVAGSAGTLRNSHCAIALGGVTTVVDFNSLTINFPITFAPGFSGTQLVYMYAANANGSTSGWQGPGGWTVPAPIAPVVTADLVIPSAGTGIEQTFAFQYTETAGGTVTTAWVWFSPSFTASSAHSCMLYYVPSTNTLKLLNDSGTAYMSAVVGSSGALQNSQCSIALSSATANVAGNLLTLNLPVTFAAGFAGSKSIFMYAADAVANSGWQTRGRWTVPAPAAAVVTADLVSPSSGSGATPTFALQYGDTAGVTDLATAWLWFSPSFTAPSSNSCLVYYVRVTNTVNLLNNAATAYTSGIAGGAGTLQNSQCSVVLSSVTVVASGSSLTLNVPVNFTPSFSGSKSVFMYAANGGDANSGWQTLGTWTVP